MARLILSIISVFLFVPADTAGAEACDPPTTSPTSFWWMAAIGYWDVGSDWKTVCSDGTHESGNLPELDIPTYVTTSEDIGFGDSYVTNTSPAATAGNLYIAGWSPSFDVDHGDPSGLCKAPPCTEDELIPASGVLHLADGAIDLGDNYIRLGYRGGIGEINHTGGRIDANRLSSIGMGSRNSVGRYLLVEDNDTATDPAVLSSRGIDVGVQGIGYFEMTGGLLDFDVDCSGCGGHIGRGYQYVGQTGDGFIPGVGVFQQSGGTFDARNISIALESASTGIAYLYQDAALEANRILIGRRGVGSVVQAGGDVSLNWCLDLGVEAGSSGTYTIENGFLNAGSTLNNHCGLGGSSLADGLNVGVEGVGAFTVVGSESTIDVRNYRQNKHSTLVAVVDDASTISPINVASKAIFENGARVRLTFPQSVGAGSGEPPNSTTDFDLVIANDIEIGGGTGTLSIVGSEAPKVSYEIIHDMSIAKDILRVTYSP